MSRRVDTASGKKRPARPERNGPPPTPAAETNPALDALADAQVNLIQLIRDGIPERKYVPGCDPWLRARKRYLWSASTGLGKTLAAEVASTDCVAAEGTAVILDVENGADEYARRLEDILDCP